MNTVRGPAQLRLMSAGCGGSSGCPPLLASISPAQQACAAAQTFTSRALARAAGANWAGRLGDAPRPGSAQGAVHRSGPTSGARVPEWGQQVRRRPSQQPQHAKRSTDVRAQIGVKVWAGGARKHQLGQRGPALRPISSLRPTPPRSRTTAASPDRPPLERQPHQSNCSKHQTCCYRRISCLIAAPGGPLHEYSPGRHVEPEERRAGADAHRKPAVCAAGPAGAAQAGQGAVRGARAGVRCGGGQRQRQRRGGALHCDDPAVLLQRGCGWLPALGHLCCGLGKMRGAARAAVADRPPPPRRPLPAAAPHMGSAYPTIAADALARYHVRVVSAAFPATARLARGAQSAAAVAPLCCGCAPLLGTHWSNNRPALTRCALHPARPAAPARQARHLCDRNRRARREDCAGGGQAGHGAPGPLR